MRRWLILAEHDGEGARLDTLDNPDAELERVASITTEADTPTAEEIAEKLEGYDGEFLLVPLDAGKVVVAKTTTSVEVDVQFAGVYC